ncbi:hypothetical protein SAMN05421505_10792 [Sinosporangium album]|uniref:Uncharacterized protein n=1 Tax=Sinosporangium album TaxID=504805 RepID=A0A1G7WLP0_9ACTN|nr:hypothetical protein [Sinosporangium album]SDG72816.1 hypothetical protein SAMN05421505_10792 [Sinosporangium album]
MGDVLLAIGTRNGPLPARAADGDRHATLPSPLRSPDLREIWEEADRPPAALPPRAGTAPTRIRRVAPSPCEPGAVRAGIAPAAPLRRQDRRATPRSAVPAPAPVGATRTG